jgi:hypothetical protein
VTVEEIKRILPPEARSVGVAQISAFEDFGNEVRLRNELGFPIGDAKSATPFSGLGQKLQIAVIRQIRRRPRPRTKPK